ncbi:MAG: hypothetical protein JWP04_2454 [Belnapia sp.]|nr:hypothetical protein [Belnapia sp.]
MIDQPEASYRLATAARARAEAMPRRGPIPAPPRRHQAAPDDANSEQDATQVMPSPSLRPEPPAEAASPPATPETAEGAGPDPEAWVSLTDCSLTNPSGPPVLVPLALLHPEFGVALLGVPEAAAAAAEAAFRRRLDAAHFAAIFPGHLPVATLAMLPGEPLNLQRRLAAAFASLPPLSLAGGDGWVAVVRRALLVRPPMRPSRPGVEAANLPPAPPAGLPTRSWRWPLAGLTGAAVLVGLMLGLTHGPAEAPQQAGPNGTAAPDQTSGAEAPVRPTAASPSAKAPPAAPAVAPAVVPPALPPVAATLPEPAPPARVVAPPAIAPPAVTLPRVLVRSAANLRAAPDTRAAVLRTAPRGEAFRVHGQAPGGWIQVGGAQPEGWIYGNLLSDILP